MAARERRDEAWKRVRRAMSPSAKKKGERPSERADLASAFEEELRLADETADRLRREAERVGKLAALLSERDVVTARSGLASFQKIAGQETHMRGDGTFPDRRPRVAARDRKQCHNG